MNRFKTITQLEQKKIIEEINIIKDRNGEKEKKIIKRIELDDIYYKKEIKYLSEIKKKDKYQKEKEARLFMSNLDYTFLN